jgi:hypothetical protein
MSDFDDFHVCEDNWEKIREVKRIGKHLNNVQCWFAADNTPDSTLLEIIHNSAEYAGKLLAYLIELQIVILNKL